MPGPITLNFMNWSLINYKLDHSYTQAENEVGVSSISQMPTDTLNGQGGGTTMSMDENAVANVAGGLCSIACGWWDQANNQRWGVKIFMPAQIIHMGPRPYYEIAYGTSTEPNWVQPVDDPAYPFSFPIAPKLIVSCTPMSQHTSLVVDVNVSFAEN